MLRSSLRGFRRFHRFDGSLLQTFLNGLRQVLELGGFVQGRFGFLQRLGCFLCRGFFRCLHQLALRCLLFLASRFDLLFGFLERFDALGKFFGAAVRAISVERFTQLLFDLG